MFEGCSIRSKPFLKKDMKDIKRKKDISERYRRLFYWKVAPMKIKNKIARVLKLLISRLLTLKLHTLKLPTLKL